MTYRITNQVLGTVIIVDELPKGVRVGSDVTLARRGTITPPPKLIVEQIAADEVRS